MDSSQAPVTTQVPPKIVLTVFNPIFGALLASPLHRLVDSSFLILHVTGRRTGARYDIVVGRHDLGGVLTVTTSAPWRLNLRGGADVEVTCDGRRRPARAELVEEPGRVAQGYAAEIERFGWKGAQRRLGLTISVARNPTIEELRDAVVREGLSLIEIRFASP